MYGWLLGLRMLSKSSLLVCKIFSVDQIARHDDKIMLFLLLVF